MSLTPTVYKSTDPGAPLLSGQPGALVTLLDALLVNGYGAGANQKAPLGWTRAFNGTNVRVYRNSLTRGTGFYLRVDDTSQRSSFLRGYSAMTDIDVGDDPTPTPAQKPAGSRWEKSFSASTDGRAWVAVGNEKFFYLFIDAANEFNRYAGAGMYAYYAGDINSFKPGDRHNFAVSYKGSDEELSSVTGYALRGGGWTQSPTDDFSTACFLGRNAAGTLGARRAFLAADGQIAIGAFGSNAALPPYPYPVNGGLMYSAVTVFEGYVTPRGNLPGLYSPIHRRPFPEQSIIADIEGMPAGTQWMAKGYMLDSLSYYEAYAGQVLIDITSEW